MFTLYVTTVLRKVRGKTKFLTESYMAYGEEKTAVLTKKFSNTVVTMCRQRPSVPQ